MESFNFKYDQSKLADQCVKWTCDGDTTTFEFKDDASMRYFYHRLILDSVLNHGTSSQTQIIISQQGGEYKWKIKITTLHQ